MKTRKAGKDEMIYTVKAQMPYKDVGGYFIEDQSPYRILAIPSQFSLNELASAVLESFDLPLAKVGGYYDDIRNKKKATHTYRKNISGITVDDIFSIYRKSKKWLLETGKGETRQFYLNWVARVKPEKNTRYPVVLIKELEPLPGVYAYFTDELIVLDIPDKDTTGNPDLKKAGKTPEKITVKRTVSEVRPEQTEEQPVSLKTNLLEQGNLEYNTENLKFYRYYLNEKLKMPAEAYYKAQEGLFGEMVYNVTLNTLLELKGKFRDQLYCGCTFGHKVISIPLNILEIHDSEPGSKLIGAYKDWFRKRGKKD